MSRSNYRPNLKVNPFSSKNTKEFGILEFKYTSSNENLVTGETFEREVHKRFYNLAMFKIIFPCTPYLLTGEKLLFSNNKFESWSVRVGEMKLEPDTKIELIEEDYEYLPSEPNVNKPFQVVRIEKYHLTGDGSCDMFVFLSFKKEEEGFLIPVQIKYRSNENMKIYDPKQIYRGGTKTLNNYLQDFDNLLSRMIFDKSEITFGVHYGFFIVSSDVNIPERYPQTKNVIMVIHDFDITIENIQEFFNRIRTYNQTNSQENQEWLFSREGTLLNKTDKAILAAQTDILETLFKNISNETWINEKEKLVKIVLDTIQETRVCSMVTDFDRQDLRYEQEIYNRKQHYLLNSKEYSSETLKETSNQPNNSFNMNNLKKTINEISDESFDILDVIKSLK